MRKGGEVVDLLFLSGRRREKGFTRLIGVKKSDEGVNRTLFGESRLGDEEQWNSSGHEMFRCVTEAVVNDLSVSRG